MLHDKIHTFITQFHMILPGQQVLVGLSGGADSVCLLHILYALQKEIPFSLAAAHVEHGIRGEASLADAAYAKKLCEQLDIPFYCRHLDVPAIAQQRHCTVEEAGRQERYAFFKELSEQIGADRIAVAHHQNDQAETILWNLARGTGLTGAGGIRPIREFTKECMLIRPLLCCSREEIEEYLCAQKISWREDETNQDAVYSRNFIRRQILPSMTEQLNHRTMEHLCEFGADLQKIEAYLIREADAVCEAAVRCEGGRNMLKIATVLQADEVLYEYVLRRWLQAEGCGLKDITREHMRMLVDLMRGQSGRSCDLPGGWRATRSFDELQLQASVCSVPGQHPPSPVSIPAPMSLAVEVRDWNGENIPQKTYTKWLNYDKISCDIQLRTRRPGDFIVINGEGGRKKLKAWFIDHKIPVDQRDHIPLVAMGSEILWIVGYRISEAYKVTEDTRKIIELKIMEETTW